jgi:hypothetical protein
MSIKPYFVKLQDPRWQKKRLAVLERDEWTCKGCGAKDKSLHVHHLAYDAGEPWEVSNVLLVTLCSDCHEAEEEIRKSAVATLIGALALCGIRSAYDVDFLATAILRGLEDQADKENPLIDGVKVFYEKWPQYKEAYKAAVEKEFGVVGDAR